MTNAINQYKTIYTIKTYDDEIDVIPSDIDQFLNDLNEKSKFIKVGTDIIAKSQIKGVRKFEASSDVEDYISQMPKGEAKKLCKEILKYREDKGYKTNGVNHLLRIAKGKRPELFPND